MSRIFIKKSISRLSILLSAFLLLLFYNCQPMNEALVPQYSYSQEAAGIVSHVTSGIIPNTEDIRVRFTEPVADNNIVGMPIKEDYISFIPSIDGELTWEDSQTLIFSPKQDLPKRKIYEGVLKLKNMAPFYSSKVDEVRFGFKTEGREIESIEGDFVLFENNDPKELYYKSTIRFTSAIELEKAKDAVHLFYEGKDLKLDWQKGSEDREYFFSSEPFERGDQRKQMLLRVSASQADISKTHEEKFFLEPLSAFTVTGVRVIEQRLSPVFEATFSDEIDPIQDLEGLISVEPYQNVKLNVFRNKVYITGDFEHGQTYQLKFQENIRSKWKTKTATEYLVGEQVPRIKPQMTFLSDGVFLPSGNNYRLRFQTVNIKNVHLEVIKVYDNNLGQFLQTEQLHSMKDRNESFNSNYVNRVGVTVVDQDLSIGTIENKWLDHDLDLKKLIKPGEKGLFLVQMNIEKEDMLWEHSSSNNYYYGDDYYSNPGSYGYLYTHGRIYKPVTVSDIGLTYKKAGDTHYIYTTDIMSANPVNGVKVAMRTFQNQVIDSGESDKEGIVKFNNIKDEVFYVEAEKNGQRSMIKLNEMAWNTTTFDVEGFEEPEVGTRAYMFTERGVYRPGDDINFSCILRNPDNTFPDNHPVLLEFINPRNQSVFSTTNKEANDGFYNFALKTAQEDPTGNWKAKITAGSRTFFHTIKVETIVPYRLKIFLTSKKERISAWERYLELNLDSTYLFGNPASNLQAEANIILQSVPKTFSKYNNYTFNNETAETTPVKQKIFDNSLDQNGHADITWKLPDLSRTPSGINAIIHTKVFETGGRATENIKTIPIDPFSHYVGIEKPDFDYGYAKIGSTLRLNTICVTPDGQAAKGRKLSYTLYKNTRYWWWEYDSHSQYRYKYKTDSHTEIITSGTFTSGTQPVAISVKPDSWGEYLIEVHDETNSGHTASLFFYASSWGGANPASKEAATLTVKTDKSRYSLGDTAIVKFPRPNTGTALVSIESGAKVLKSYWVKLGSSNAEEEILRIPITKEMIPSAYVSVSIIQPHEQTTNDRPIRMYGIAALNSVDPDTDQKLTIKTSDEFRPQTPFSVEIQTADKKESQFVIAVVDEGLLDITNFPTPDPWNYFFHKQRLAVLTCDLFSDVIGAQKGDPFKVFSIGGSEGYDQSMIGAKDKDTKRFKPVSLFKGPLKTNSSGYAKVSFTMPNYIGSVRIMVISANGRKFGSASATVPVKTELMVMPTLPRVLGPGENFEMPVTIFAMQDNMKPINTSVHIEGPIEVVGAAYMNVVIGKKGDRDITYNLRTENATGSAKIKIKAVSGDYTAEEEIDIVVRSTSPRVYNSKKESIGPGAKKTIYLPSDSIPGTMNAKLTIQRHKFLDFDHRYEWLIHYPYGCIEQTTSAVFPQLYLNKLMTLNEKRQKEIDKNINAGIDRLSTFQTSSGGFGYWPGNTTVHIWGTNYAGHFLIEAKKLGYAVPDNLYNNWLKFQKSRALSGQDEVKTRVYRSYLLALAGEALLSEMNVLRENHITKMSNADKWMLAAAYKLAGANKSIYQDADSYGTTIPDYREYGGTYGSPFRDQAMILEAMTQLEAWNRAPLLYENIAERLSGSYWYSTQELGYSLLAIGKYLAYYGGALNNETPVMSGSIVLPDGKTVRFSEKKMKFEYPIESGFGRNFTVTLDSSVKVPMCFVTLEWNGVPLRPSLYSDTEKNLRLDVTYYNEDGMVIDPQNLPPGITFYAVYHASKLDRYKKLEELALVQIIPSGWEIDNTRLKSESLPSWATSRSNSFVLNQEEYVDIRDDRIMWFFDMQSYNTSGLHFIVKLTTVTQGTFVWPPAVFEAMYDNNYQTIVGSDSVNGYRTVTVDKNKTVRIIGGGK